MSIFKISTQKSHALHPTCKPWLLSVPLFQLFSIFEMISALLFPYLPTRSFILIILVNPIIVIQQILCPIKSEHSKCRHINLLHRFSHFCDRDAFSFPDEQRYFVQCDFHVMHAFFQNLFRNGSVRKEFHEFHPFWQIDIDSTIAVHSDILVDSAV